MHCVHHFVIRHLPHYCSHHHHPLALLFLLLFSHWCSQCFPAHWASWYRRAVMAQPPPGPCSATPSGPQTTPQQQQTTTGASCAQKACTAHADQLLLRGSQCRTAAAGMRQRAKTGATTSDARIETVKSPVTAWTSLVKSGSGPSKLQGQGPRRAAGQAKSRDCRPRHSHWEPTQQEETAGVQRGLERDLPRVTTRGVVQQ